MFVCLPLAPAESSSVTVGDGDRAREEGQRSAVAERVSQTVSPFARSISCSHSEHISLEVTHVMASVLMS